MGLKWLNLKKIYSLNYGDQIIKSFIVSSYAKKKLNILMMMLVTIIIRCILCSFLTFIFSYNCYIDFFIHSFVSVVVVLKSHWIYDIIEKRHKYFYSYTKYIINNYTAENYRRWKRNIVLGISLYLIILLLIFKINNQILIIYIVQYIFTYFVIDIIEHNKIETFINKIKNKPKNMLFNEIEILDDYCKITENKILKKNKSDEYNKFNKSIKHNKLNIKKNKFVMVKTK